MTKAKARATFNRLNKRRHELINKKMVGGLNPREQRVYDKLQHGYLLDELMYQHVRGTEMDFRPLIAMKAEMKLSYKKRYPKGDRYPPMLGIRAALAFILSVPPIDGREQLLDFE